MGRAFTLQLMPMRPDVSEVDQADRRGKNQLRLSYQTAIDMLQKGNVVVVDACGSDITHIIEGRYVSTDIYSRPHDIALLQEYEATSQERLGGERYDAHVKRHEGRGLPRRSRRGNRPRSRIL